MQHRIMRSALCACLVYCTLVSRTGGAADYDNNCQLGNPLVMLMSIDTRLKEQNEGMKCLQTNDGKRSCYKFVRSPVNWSQARKFCQALKDKADLVSIESEVEMIFLANVIQELHHDCGRFHTSGRKVYGSLWMWQATGKKFSYTAWATGQPDNSGDGMHLWSNVKGWMTWDDYLDTHKACFICEYR